MSCTAEQAETYHRSATGNAGCVENDFFNLARRSCSALERGSIWQLEAHKDVTLVLIGEKRGGQLRPDKNGDHRDQCQEEKAKAGFADQKAGKAHVAIRCPAKDPVEQCEEARAAARAIAFAA